MELTKITCNSCGAVNNRNAIVCVACGESLGPVNVNLLSDEYFQDGLKLSYSNVQAAVTAAGKSGWVQDFEEEVNMNSKAVINMDGRFLHKLMTENEDYLPYQRAVEQSKRFVADFENDLKRCVVETAFYGFTGRNLVYAALSLNENGLRSYGDVSVVLKTAMIERRTTVFEKNSYPLFDELTDAGWKAGTTMPTGHCGTWNERSIVSVVKHGREIAGKKNAPDFAGLILRSDKKKSNDEFIELHIFNKVTNVVFEKVVFHEKLRKHFDKDKIKIFLLNLKAKNIKIIRK